MENQYKQYIQQAEKVKELEAEYKQSQEELSIKKEMMVFPSSDVQTSPISKLDKKGSDSGKTRTISNFTDDEVKNQKTALSKAGTVEQENESHKKQLTDAGLFGKKREELSGESLRALEALEKTHRDSLAKLDADAITKFLDQKKAANDRELSDLQIKQNNELASVKTLDDAKRVLSESLSADELNNIQTMEQAKKALTDRNNREERDVTRRHAGEMNKVIADIQNKTGVKGLKLADGVISPEESKLLESRMQQVQDILARMAASEAQASMELVAAREKAYAEATKAAMTGTEQENQAYAERLTNCGLFGKRKEELTGEALRTMEALEKAHQKKLNEIDRTAIANYATKKQSAYQQELSEQKTKQNEEYASIKTFRQAKERLAQSMSDQELSGINSLADARKVLQNEYANENRQTVARQTAELMGILQTVMDGKGVPDLKLSDHVLSEEESKELQERITQAKEALAQLGVENMGANEAQIQESGVDLLGMTPERWQIMFDNLAMGKLSIEDMQGATDAMFQGWGMVNELMSAKENKEVKNYEQNTKKKKDALNKQLNDGQISQEQYNARVAQLDSELDAKKEEVERKQAKRQKAIAITQIITNTALSIAKTAAAIAFPWNIPFIAMAAALGAVQLATVMNQPDGFKKGGFTSTAPSDDQEAGVVHANEFVATADAVRNPGVLPVLQMIDQAQRNGTIHTLDLSNTARQGFRSGGFTSGNPAGDIVTFQSVSNSLDPELRQLLTAILATTKELRDKNLSIPWYGRGGIDEKMKKAQKYEQNLTY